MVKRRHDVGVSRTVALQSVKQDLPALPAQVIAPLNFAPQGHELLPGYPFWRAGGRLLPLVHRFWRSKPGVGPMINPSFS
jgi:hypothetical protein